MTTIFASNTGKIKKITTTIKGYFTDKNANYIVKYATTVGNNEPSTRTIEPNTKEGRKGLYGAKYEEFYDVPYYFKILERWFCRRFSKDVFSCFRSKRER